MKAKVNGHWFTWEKQMVEIQGLTSSNEGLKFHDSERVFRGKIGRFRKF